MALIREHAKELITIQADEGLKNLRAQLQAAHERGNLAEIVHFERRIAERKRFLGRMKTDARMR